MKVKKGKIGLIFSFPGGLLGSSSVLMESLLCILMSSLLFIREKAIA